MDKIVKEASYKIKTIRDRRRR